MHNEQEPTAAQELATLRAEFEELSEKHLRLVAEFQNFRRRSSAEAAEREEAGLARLVVGMLPALTALFLAQEVPPTKATDWEKGALSATAELFGALKKAGVQLVAQVGVPLDPAVHEVVAMDETAPAGTVAAVLSPGFVVGGRVIAAARVRAGSANSNAQS